MLLTKGIKLRDSDEEEERRSRRRSSCLRVLAMPRRAVASLSKSLCCLRAKSGGGGGGVDAEKGDDACRPAADARPFRFPERASAGHTLLRKRHSGPRWPGSRDGSV
ncbi:hypothetical protein HIM_04617 [Hirsutella minnesotensis 3608]|uniref:Uncharacterized protein n=1 Tax=Hirsutella minnesotensis 3608 TaxID=1043627 RepID=A0A0F7ZLA2_9HYPO|nr:hypothetical protein HIM_04617 [Hirsutella minnesotensis 3608]